ATIVLSIRARSVNSAATRSCVRRSERGVSGTVLAMSGMLRGRVVLRRDCHDLAVAPDHGVLAEPALTLQGLGHGAAQSIHRLLVFLGERGHGWASLTSCS